MSAKYLKWVRNLPCIICGTDQAVQAHHELGSKTGGTGYKCSDYRTIPLCPVHHAEIHQTGHVTFEKKYAIRQSDEVLRTILFALEEGVLHGN